MIRIRQYALSWALVVVAAGCRERQAEYVFACGTAVAAIDDVESLVRRYGAENVSQDSVHIGEGIFTPGTILYANDSSRRLEIQWKDTVAKRSPSAARITRVFGGQTRWRTRDGISIGTDLKTIEKTNRGPFVLLGFGWDYAGTVMSWSDGALDRPESQTCRVRLRLSPIIVPTDSARLALYTEVVGDKEFPSNHPAMRVLNPRVYDLFLSFE